LHFSIIVSDFLEGHRSTLSFEEDFSSIETLEAPTRRGVSCEKWIKGFGCHIVGGWECPDAEGSAKQSRVPNARNSFGKLRTGSAHPILFDINLFSGLCFGQPSATQLLGGDAGHVRLDVENRGSVEHIDATDAELRAFASEQLDD